MFDNKDSYTAKEYSRNKRIFKIIKIIIFASYFFLLIFFINGITRNSNNILGIFFISGLIYFALIIVNSLDRENIGDRKRNYYTWGKGAGAEGVVGNQLSALGTEYKIISDFQTGRGNIDFIVVGPKGIFTIEVKADKGVISYQNETLLVNGKTTIKNYVRQTMAESLFLSDLLYKKFGRKYFVTGILEFPYGKIDTNSIHGKIDEIWIGGAYFHEYAINKSLNILSKEQVNSIVTSLK